VTSAPEVKLRAGIPQLLKYLDERGILLSIASNNDHQSAWKQLTRLGIADYFLYPQIDWTPKSRNISAIAKQLGIGLDSRESSGARARGPHSPEC